MQPCMLRLGVGQVVMKYNFFAVLLEDTVKWQEKDLTKI